MFIRGYFSSVVFSMSLISSTFLPLLASFNHATITRVPCTRSALLSAGALVLIAVIFLCAPKHRRCVGPLCIAARNLTAVCALFQAKGPWKVDSNDMPVTGLPGAVAVIVYGLAWLLNRRNPAPPPSRET